MNFEMTLPAPFNLGTTRQYFGDWAAFSADPTALALAFPVEGWRTSAAVILRQPSETRITGEVYGAGADAEQAWQQALATLSLDSPAQGWPEVGQRDPVIGRLQIAYDYLRPVIFYSPYEAAASFIISHRISMRLGRAIRQKLAEQLGDQVAVGDTTLPAFPRPQVLRDLTAFPGLSAVKIERLQGIAAAALADPTGLLDRASLRALPVDEALARLRTLPGIGPFFAQGILMRGAGLEDSVPDDEAMLEAVQHAYHLPQRPSPAQVQEIAEPWRPYRMWAAVLLHVWLFREAAASHRQGA